MMLDHLNVFPCVKTIIFIWDYSWAGLWKTVNCCLNSFYLRIIVDFETKVSAGSKIYNASTVCGVRGCRGPIFTPWCFVLILPPCLITYICPVSILILDHCLETCRSSDGNSSQMISAGCRQWRRLVIGERGACGLTCVGGVWVSGEVGLLELEGRGVIWSHWTRVTLPDAHVSIPAASCILLMRNYDNSDQKILKPGKVWKKLKFE